MTEAANQANANGSYKEPAYYDNIREAAQRLAAELQGFRPQIGLILGSGLGELAESITDSITIPYERIPHFPVSTVTGHAGRFVFGKLEGKRVAVMQGRFHYYEGYSMKNVVFPVYVMKLLGVSALFVSNAAGGMNRSFQPGDLMIITDHINMTGNHPLIGANDERLGPRFPDLSEAYDRAWISALKADLQRVRISDLRLREGVYCGISGPSYMTPAELNMLATIGGDAVGMSTVAEVIAARHCGLKVLGVSCITDMAIGAELEPLTHEQVVAEADMARPIFIELAKRAIRAVPDET